MNLYDLFRLVDNEILSILRHRFEDCAIYEAPDQVEKCKPLLEEYKNAELNWYIKCKQFSYYFS